MAEMKTEYKRITFVGAHDGAGSWVCFNSKQELLGYVEYDKEWKQWVSVLDNDIKFSGSCHTDMAHFINQLNKMGKPK